MNDAVNKDKDFFSLYQNRGDQTSDHRYLPRWKVNNRVKYVIDNGLQVSECRTADLSCSGACLKLPRILVPGQLVKMKIYLDENQSIEVDGHVVWNKIGEDSRYAGVLFDTASKQIQEMILNFAFEINKENFVRHWFSDWNENNPDAE